MAWGRLHPRIGGRLVLLVLVLMVIPLPAVAYDPGFAGFSIRVNDITIPYRVFFLSVEPGEPVRIEVISPGHDQSYQAVADDVELSSWGRGHWEWGASRVPGQHQLRVVCAATADTITLNAFVTVPRSQMEGEYLNGYRIGKYPKIRYKGLAVYDPPTGFIEVTPDNTETPVSPHFRLGDFLCKQESDFPKYVVLREELLLKLELVLQKANEGGVSCERFFVMSGFRTPHYNAAIGNVKYSRHQWGGAADIFIDENPADGEMDDLNGDGRINWRDAAVLYDIIDALYEDLEDDTLVGGLGRYKRTSNHGPFVHVDVRGFRARWGE